MMKKNNRLFLICLLLCSILTFQCGCQFIGTTSAFSVQDHIYQTFEALGIDDATLLDNVVPLSEDHMQPIVYKSESTQMLYYFAPEDGQLTSIYHDYYFDTGHGIEDLRKDNSPALSEVELEALLLDFAEKCITPNQIGELYIARKYECGTRFFNYIIAEIYEGVETGTLVNITLIDDGTITNASITIGSVFNTNSNGHVTPANPNQMIGEEVAIEYAMNAMAEDLPDGVDAALSEKITCQQRADGDVLAYYVIVPYLNTNGIEMEYRVFIEAYTGEVVTSSHR